MDNYKNIWNKLIMVKNHIMKMPNTMQKVNMIEGFYQLLYYYGEITGLNNIEYNKLDLDDEFTVKHDRYIVSSNQKMINEFTKVAPYLDNSCNQIVNQYQKEGFCSFECNEIKANKYKMYELVWNFFSFLGDDVLDIYKKMINNNNVFLINESDYYGISMNSLAIDNPCIIIQNVENYFNYYVTLVHEIGHCYQFYLQRNQPNYPCFNPYSEITSLLFEKLFIKYLYDNHIIKDTYDYDLEDHIYYLNDVSATKVLCNLFVNKDIKNINAFSLSYETSKSKDELLNEMVSLCGYIMPNKLNMELTEIHYFIGNSIAMYFMNCLKNDFKMEWKNFKNFICTVNYLSMKDVLDKCFDINLIKDNIKEFTKSYRER